MNEINKRISQIQSLENGRGFQYILNETCRILGNPSMLFNMDYQLLTCTENIITDDPLWNELVETGVFGNESIKFFLDEDFIDIVAGTKSTTLLTSDKLKYDRFYGRIFNSNNSTVADLIMIACNKPFEDHDQLAFEAICAKLSQEASTNEFFQQYGVLYHEDLICKLLDRNFDDKLIYSDHVSNLYEGLGANLYVAVADIGKCNTKDRGLEEFRDLFKKSQPEFKYAVYSQYIIILVSTDETALDIERDLSKLNELFERDNIFVGVSGHFDNLFDLQKHYNEAVHSLKLGLDKSARQWSFPYNDTEKESVH